MQDAAPQPPAAPTGLMAVPGEGQVDLSWSPAPGATSYNVKRSIAPVGPFHPIAPPVSVTSFRDPDLVNGTTYHYVVSGSNGGGEGPNSAMVSATPVATPAWSSEDIGAVGRAGSFRQDGETFTVSGAGEDFYTTADAFRFVYQPVTGNATITARVASLQAVYVWSKAAVMMRDGRTPDARNVAVLTSPTASNGYRLQARTSAGASTSTERSTSGTTPVWLRLVRVGNDFTGFTSQNGTGWTQLGTTKTIAMPATILIGLAVTSHDTTQTTTATFDNVTITRP